MKKTSIRLLAAFLVAVVLVSSSAFAASEDISTDEIETETETEAETQKETEMAANPETEAETETETETEAETEAETAAASETEIETEAETETESQVKSVTSVTKTYYTNTTEYAEALFAALKSHKETLDIYVVVQSKDESSSIGNDSYNLAIEHTGNGDEGDYFYAIVKSRRFLVKSYGEFEEGYLYEHIWTIDYYTTKKQEEYVSSKVSSIISSLSLSGKSNYQKVKAIHDYMIKHFSQANTEEGSYSDRCSAYALLKNKTGNCRAFSSLFYRLCLTAGVDARYIKGGGHAWNIVKVDGKYYCIDVMWDTVAEKYFLKGTTEFMTNHSAIKSGCFYDYNVSSTDYVPASSADEKKSDTEDSVDSSQATSKSDATEKTNAGTAAEAAATEAGSDVAEAEAETKTEDANGGIDTALVQKLHEAYMNISVAQNLQLIKYGKTRTQRVAELIENADHILLSPCPSGVVSANKLTTEKFQTAIENKEETESLITACPAHGTTFTLCAPAFLSCAS